MNKLKNKQKVFLVFTGIIIVGLALYYFYVLKDDGEEIYQNAERNVLIPYEENETETNETIEKVNNNIMVDVSGEVNEPGVIELEEGKRIKDAIELAGGLTNKADTTNINLAYKLEDGMKIQIPSKEEKNKTIQDNYISVDAGKNIENSEPNNIVKNKKSIININTANQKELETLPGIGESTAQKIIKYREEKGKFKKIEELKNVSGIGDAKFEKIKEYIKV